MVDCSRGHESLLSIGSTLQLISKSRLSWGGSDRCAYMVSCRCSSTVAPSLVIWKYRGTGKTIKFGTQWPACTMADPVCWHQSRISVPKTCIQNTPHNKGKVFYCVQINYSVDGCETIAHREFRYSQLKVLHKRLQRNFQKHPDVTIAPFPARSTKVLDRQVMLEAYLQAIVASEVLSKSAEFVAFMKMNSTAKGIRKPSFNHLRIKTPRFSPL